MENAEYCLNDNSEKENRNAKEKEYDQERT
jgi:hypothetical protein